MSGIARNPYEANRGAPLVVGRAQLVETTGRHGLCMPSRDQLGYARELMIVVLMVVAFPWLLRMAFNDPRAIVPAAAAK